MITEMVFRCISSGMNNYLAKPVRAQTLKALLESYLDKENEGKEIPNLAAEAKNMVRQALSEANTSKSEGDGDLESNRAVDQQNPSLQIRTRPRSIRKVTAQRIPPNGEKEPGS